MRILRTPGDRFADLPGFPYEPRYAEVGDGLRMAYVEDGPEDGEPVVLLHGEPSWSFLYRHVMPELAAAGLRAIAVDLIGFGRSDKPADLADHSYARHVEWTRALLLDALGLTGMTVVGQDWGGLIGLRVAAEHPERVARIVAANTGLPTGDIPMPEVWHRFRDAVLKAPVLDIARLVQAGCRTELSKDVRAAYDAPFPDESYKAGPRAMPGLVPITPDDPAAPANRAAWRILTALDRPVLVAFSDGDPITGGMAPILRESLRGAAGLRHPVIKGAGHFLQEDAGPELGRQIALFVTST
ncbi:Hydrolase, alpha/beta fold family protein, At1g52510/AT4G12830 homolog, group4 [[Actinomadura] parvosata subsp. kistnae]|uniref:Haloalkane dehalogenase n=1 Tax=[Actinomadura] parvosata subsp. kistnae TaxID=1909395 RepID=A0A1V0AI61_9ACTN|nr:haloalkane dehalogenase [Nonomuraea sp. ATCC 55076]AQZ69896.1 haloalkane dehalogenase [Nonomuraea sp. ATCC 55076]SPL90215.1 Hydrolase, alpha/beta fold family protein, At1g52510/AT4G12830 homolog, group4 [Actinomadura parvosata subsp. kistnae]